MLRTGPGADQAGLVSLAVPCDYFEVKGVKEEKQYSRQCLAWVRAQHQL